jgi:Family of unknown function (DUF6339)
MSTLKVFKESVVNSLRELLKTDVSRYQLDTPWVEQLFPARALFATTKLADLPDDLLIMPEGDEKFDLENSERLYSALRGLTLTQAADPRLWTYLTHVKYWRYMRKRWPIKEGADASAVSGSIVSRYFLVGDKARSLTRNGIARLWWAGHTCYSPGVKQSDFAYAKALFATQDVYASLMERAFSKNRKIIQPVLSVLTKEFEKGSPFDDRDQVRDLGKHLVLLGGAMVLDILDPVTIEGIVEKFIGDLNQDTSAPIQ